MSVKPRKASAVPEDTSGLAGWIFADLILGLMVVFLATISFIPVIEDFQGPASTAGLQTTALARLYPEPFQKTYPNPTSEVVERDLTEFISQNSLPENAIISFVELSGAYDPVSQDSSSGVLKAVAFHEVLISNSTFFNKGISVKFVGWPSGDSNEIRIKLYLIYDQEVRVD